MAAEEQSANDGTDPSIRPSSGRPTQGHPSIRSPKERAMYEARLVRARAAGREPSDEVEALRAGTLRARCRVGAQHSALGLQWNRNVLSRMCSGG